VQKEDFVHLHLHSEYSLLDGAIRIDDLLKKAEEFNMPSVAITDHGNMFGAVDFYQKGFNSSVKPIIGCEVYVAPKSRFDKETQNPDEDRSHHLILLVKNLTGYRNICKLVSAGFTEGFYYKPRIDKELLSQHNEGLIALSACLKGEVARKLVQEKEAEAKDAVAFYKDVFGDRYYLEIQDHGIADQQKVNPPIVSLAKEFGIKVVATNDAHYLLKEHAHAHDALICIGTGRILSDTNRMKYSGDQFYFKSADEMKKLFDWIPEAVTNTREVAERCNINLNLGEYHLPEYKVPADTTPNRYLEDLVEHNLESRLAKKEKSEGELEKTTIQKYKERLKMELGVINKMKFAGYFLITWDFINYAVEHNVPVGPGRGSAAGSLVAYCLGITDIDPLKYDLLFERFLNPERISMPDIDIDFCMEKRGKVIDYVEEKYGIDNVAQIITFGRMKAKAVIRDVGRVMDMPYTEVDRIAKLIPDELKMTIEKALKQEKRLAELEKKDATVKELLDTAKVLEGVARHASTHAAGVVIAPSKLTNYLPLYKTSKGDIVTQFPMTDCETLGLLKMDFLGLRTLTVLEWTAEKIRAKKDVDFNIKNIPIDDKATYDLLSEAKTIGVFQLESSGMRDIIRKLKPETFTDIIALVALYRPGPIQSGMIDSFVKRKHGTEKIENILSEMNEALEETYGVIVYQEQVMKLANTIGGFTLSQADNLRKAMGKKKMDVMQSMRKLFLDGADKKKIDLKKAEEVFDLMVKFAEYGFNKSHSAAYALIAYQTAYLKKHFPQEFMASILSSEMDNTDKVVFYLNECRNLGIEVKPPDINLSDSMFTVDGDSIVFGLAAVKNVGQNGVAQMVEEREKNGDFKSAVDFIQRVDPKNANKRALESLIKCGAFDSLHENRYALFHAITALMDEASDSRDEALTGQGNMFANIESPEEQIKRIIPDYPDWAEHDKLIYEKETVGFYITGHPLEPYAKDIKRLSTHRTSDIADANNKESVIICGVVGKLKVTITKKKKAMANIDFEDMEGIVKVLVWPDTFEKVQTLLDSSLPLLIQGHIDADESETKIIAEEIRTLKDAKSKFTEEVLLKLNLLGLEDTTIDKIKDVAKQNTGKSKLILYFNFPNKRKLKVVASNNYRVSASEEFEKEIEELLGENSIHYNCAVTKPERPAKRFYDRNAN